MPYNLNTDFDIELVMETLEVVGGASLPIITERDRLDLLTEAQSYEYHRRPAVVGKASVRQDFSGVDYFPPNSPFHTLRDEWQSLLTEKIRQLSTKVALFNSPLNFNDLSLQRYEAGSIGITPHRDSSCNINLICIFVLTGHSRFGLCRDREGTEIIARLDDSPGNVIMLRAPGFKTSRPQPFHFVTSIQELRINFGLRQVAE